MQRRLEESGDEIQRLRVLLGENTRSFELMSEEMETVKRAVGALDVTVEKKDGEVLTECYHFPPFLPHSLPSSLPLSL